MFRQFAVLIYAVKNIICDSPLSARDSKLFRKWNWGSMTNETELNKLNQYTVVNSYEGETKPAYRMEQGKKWRQYLAAVVCKWMWLWLSKLWIRELSNWIKFCYQTERRKFCYWDEIERTINIKYGTKQTGTEDDAKFQLRVLILNRDYCIFVFLASKKKLDR